MSSSTPETGTRRSWTVVIDGWHPTSVNRLMGNPFEASRRKKADAQRVALAMAQAGVPRVGFPRSQIRDARKQRIDLLRLSNAPTPKKRRLEVRVILRPIPRDGHGKFRKRSHAQSRFYDADNLNKSVRDALVDGGWLVDDSPAWIEGTDPLQERGEHAATVITLTDLS